jgi:quercetin dioxygenase-like cupin family protein
MTDQNITRRQLLSATLGQVVLTSADVHEIQLKPGEVVGRHIHPCNVLGYIVDGDAIYQVEGQPEQLWANGSAFYEPANTVITKFGNASTTEPMTFIAFYLLNGDQELIRML